MMCVSPLDSSARARRGLSDWRCEQLDVRQSVSRCFVGRCICAVLKEAWESAPAPSLGWYRGRHAPAASARPDAWLPGCLDARSRRQYPWTYRSCRDPCTYVAAGKASPLPFHASPSPPLYISPSAWSHQSYLTYAPGRSTQPSHALQRHQCSLQSCPGCNPPACYSTGPELTMVHRRPKRRRACCAALSSNGIRRPGTQQPVGLFTILAQGRTGCSPSDMSRLLELPLAHPDARITGAQLQVSETPNSRRHHHPAVLERVRLSVFVDGTIGSIPELSQQVMPDQTMFCALPGSQKS